MVMFRLHHLLFTIFLLGYVATATTDAIKLGLLNGGSTFFEPVGRGFMSKCQELGIECLVRLENPNYTSSAGYEHCYSKQVVIDEFIAEGVDGIALKPCDEYNIESATSQNIPVVTFDSDFNETDRAAYIGTDQVFLGRTMARLLRQLRPGGGTFVIVGAKEGRDEGFLDEIMKDNHRSDRAHWYPLDVNLTKEYGYEMNGQTYYKQLMAYASYNPTAIITQKQSPMKAKNNWTQFVDLNSHSNITYIGVDGADYQLEYLNSRYVDGLIGQLPYEFGTTSAQRLYELAKAQKMKFENGQTVFPTNLVAYNLIPLELPSLELDHNLIGNLKYIGYTCFGIIAWTSIASIGWTLRNRKDSLVVKAAQPFFLLMIATGVLVMSGSLIPLSFDDNAESLEMSDTRAVAICMSVPWLSFTGFTIVFSALFSKTWR